MQECLKFNDQSPKLFAIMKCKKTILASLFGFAIHTNLLAEIYKELDPQHILISQSVNVQFEIQVFEILMYIKLFHHSFNPYTLLWCHMNKISPSMAFEAKAT